MANPNAMFQHAHMMAGVAKAAASPKTPMHLKPHLQRRLTTMKMMKQGGFRGAPTMGSSPFTGNQGDMLAPDDASQTQRSLVPVQPSAMKAKRSMGPTNMVNKAMKAIGSRDMSGSVPPIGNGTQPARATASYAGARKPSMTRRAVLGA